MVLFLHLINTFGGMSKIPSYHYVSAVFVFDPNDTIPICCYNVPELVHNSATATIGGVNDKLERYTTDVAVFALMTQSWIV